MGSVRVRIWLRVVLLVLSLILITDGVYYILGVGWSMLACGLLIAAYVIAFYDDGKDSG